MKTINAYLVIIGDSGAGWGWGWRLEVWGPYNVSIVGNKTNYTTVRGATAGATNVARKFGLRIDDGKTLLNSKSGV